MYEQAIFTKHMSIIIRVNTFRETHAQCCLFLLETSLVSSPLSHQLHANGGQSTNKFRNRKFTILNLGTSLYNVM
jgi:hypothetical protein